MDELLKSVKDTPVPNILIVGGLVFLLLAVAGSLAGKIEVPKDRQKWAATIGIILLIVGLILYIVPVSPTAQATPTAVGNPPSPQTTEPPIPPSTSTPLPVSDTPTSAPTDEPTALPTEMPTTPSTVTPTLSPTDTPTVTTPCPQAAPASDIPMIAIGSPGLYVRSAPSTGSEFILDYVENQDIPLTGRSVEGTYYRVIFNQQTAWILGSSTLNGGDGISGHPHP